MANNDKSVKNSLLSAASSNFFLEDYSSSLLVPVNLTEEIQEATDEVDLNQNDDEDELKLIPASANEEDPPPKQDQQGPLDFSLHPPPPPLTTTQSMSSSSSSSSLSYVQSFFGVGGKTVPPPPKSSEERQVKPSTGEQSDFQNIKLGGSIKPPPPPVAPVQVLPPPPPPVSTIASTAKIQPPPSAREQGDVPVTQSVNFFGGSEDTHFPDPFASKPLEMTPSNFFMSSTTAPPQSTSSMSFFQPQLPPKVSSPVIPSAPPSTSSYLFTPSSTTSQAPEMSQPNPNQIPMSMQNPPPSMFAPTTVLPMTPPTNYFVPSAPPPQQTTTINSTIQGHTPPPPATTSMPPQSSSQSGYRLGGGKLSYAKYPGIQTTSAHLPPPPSMGNVPSVSGLEQPPLGTAPPPLQVLPIPTQPSQQQNILSPTSPFSPDPNQGYNEGSETGYSFGAPYSQPTYSNIPQIQQYIYQPPTYHWYFSKEFDSKIFWRPLSHKDSKKLEDALAENRINEPISIEGGRFDVIISERSKKPVYWEESPSEVKRCSWYYKEPMDSRFVPYDEEFSKSLEEAYASSCETGIWQKRLDFRGGEAIVFHSEAVIVHFCQQASPDEWGNLPESELRPRVVKRGTQGIGEIEDGEPDRIDTLVLTVHGIGSVCDFKCRDIVEAVDDFRSLSNQLVHNHFKGSIEGGLAGRIEFLPVSWHQSLHSEGIDEKLQRITLKSIPKLRNFANDTLLDILFYTSPIFCQRIVDTVAGEMNRLFNLFQSRNPDFNGRVAVCGHSLGSLILFDILSHQLKPPSNNNESEPKVNTDAAPEGIENATISGNENSQGLAGTGQQPYINYKPLHFQPTAFFALGTPIAMFETVRGKDMLGFDFHFPTCPAFFNIFHPYDPVAYRMEMLIEPSYDFPPVLIPHHKGRMRMHLEIKDVVARYGYDIKNKLVQSLRATWNNFSKYLKQGELNEEFNQAVQHVKESQELVVEGDVTTFSDNMCQTESGLLQVKMGKLNGGRRIDYVLQEAPLESFNEYLFALGSHVCYWESEDTLLLIIKEVYSSMGIFEDSAKGSNIEPCNKQQRETQFDYRMSYPYNEPLPSNVRQQPTLIENNLLSAGQLFGPPPQPLSSAAAAPPPPSSVPLMNINSNASETQLLWKPPMPPTFSTISLSSPNSSNLPSQHSSLVIGGRPNLLPPASGGMDPTSDPILSGPCPPPPKSGFIRR